MFDNYTKINSLRLELEMILLLVFLLDSLKELGNDAHLNTIIDSFCKKNYSNCQ